MKNKSLLRVILKFIIAYLLLHSVTAYAAAKSVLEKQTVTVYKVSTTAIYDLYKYPVIIEPKYEREIYAEITGFVQNIYVTVGGKVQKDDILMHLKPTGPGYTEQALTIKSPMCGQIAQVAKKIGSHIKPDDLLIHIVEPNDLTIKIEIPQAELKLLQVKQQGKVKVRTIAEPLAVVVTGVSAIIDQATGTSTGQLDWLLDDIDINKLQLIKDNIYPGMLGYATFKLNKRMSLVVPTKAILHEKNEEKVRLVQNGKAFKKTVKVGKQLEQGLSEVIDGLQVGDVVIVNTGKYIRENEEVIIKEEQAK